MRLARNLLLAATAAIAAMAFMATSAFAQSVEVVTEPGGVHCGEVVEESNHDTSGGCTINAVSIANAQTLAHTGAAEVVTTSCENEFTGNINEEGTGYIDTTELTIHENEPTGCPLEVCEESESRPVNQHAELEWPISGILEYGGEREEMIVTFCIRLHNAVEGTGSTCTITPAISQNKATHVITITAVEEPCHENPASELSGQWRTVGASSGIEIIHNHYPGDYPAS